MVAVPGIIPLTTPDEFIVAMVVGNDDQLPPVEVVESVVVPPIPTTLAPVIGFGVGLTVIVSEVIAQLFSWV